MHRSWSTPMTPRGLCRFHTAARLHACRSRTHVTDAHAHTQAQPTLPFQLTAYTGASACGGFAPSPAYLHNGLRRQFARQDGALHGRQVPLLREAAGQVQPRDGAPLQPPRRLQAGRSETQQPRQIHDPWRRGDVPRYLPVPPPHHRWDQAAAPAHTMAEHPQAPLHDRHARPA